jgi:hypothetical protein
MTIAQKKPRQDLLVGVETFFHSLFLHHVGGLRALFPLYNLKVNCLSFSQGFKAISFYR